MGEMTARQKIKEADPPYVAKLEPEKAARFKAETMLIPSPLQVQDAILKIPNGDSVTLKDLRSLLAEESDADVTCPYMAGVCWRLVAEAAEEERAEGAADVAPWWRVTKDKKPYGKLPGGETYHRALLRAEGVEI